MSPWFLWVLAVWMTRVAGQVVLHVSRDRSRALRKKEDYTFESKLKRATEECSYIARNDDESHRMELIQRIKDEMNNRKVVEFYEAREAEKKKAKEFYGNVEREQREKALLDGGPPQGKRVPGRNLRRPPGPPLPPPPMPPYLRNQPPRQSRDDLFPSYPFPGGPPFGEDARFTRGGIFKRSPKSKDPSFSQGSFKDHNNCFSRCVFARMELVDFLGFPQESYLRKTLEDHIDNVKTRSRKIRRLRKCFDDVKKVAIDDNCIYSTRIFKCMRLDEPASWP